jgi:hypothetical protein
LTDDATDPNTDRCVVGMVAAHRRAMEELWGTAMKYEHERLNLVGQPDTGDTRRQVIHRIVMIVETNNGERRKRLFDANIMAADSEQEQVADAFLDLAVAAANAAQGDDKLVATMGVTAEGAVS